MLILRNFIVTIYAYDGLFELVFWYFSTRTSDGIVKSTFKNCLTIVACL